MKKIVSQVNEDIIPLQHEEIIFRKQRGMIAALLAEDGRLFCQNIQKQKSDKYVSEVELWVLEPEEIQEYIEYTHEKKEWKEWRENRQSYNFSLTAKCEKEDVDKLFGPISKVYIGERDDFSFLKDKQE
ncbi:MAG: hypothetical protein J6R57_02855 [Bacteroidales bacterium]|nr:hypothetical protein [Bacteroidales bacterium]